MCFSALSRDPREGRDSAPRAFARRPRGVRVRGGRLSVLSLPSDVVVWFRHQVKPAPEPGLRNTPSLPVVSGGGCAELSFLLPRTSDRTRQGSRRGPSSLRGKVSAPAVSRIVTFFLLLEGVLVSRVSQRVCPLHPSCQAHRQKVAGDGPLVSPPPAKTGAGASSPPRRPAWNAAPSPAPAPSRKRLLRHRFSSGGLFRFLLHPIGHVPLFRRLRMSSSPRFRF